MLTAGTRLGSYDVVALIGSGGMGEVYQAHDTKLGRDVAIKVLPEAFAHDPQRLSRFQREAKVLASLNHPNIATIHGLEETNGAHYLVMELVPGETLRERIAREGAVPVEEALKIAVQIAEALEAAHEKSIIHRDLKPANVKVTQEGKVKVLDFGLAKAFEGDPGTQDLGNSPTLSRAATMQGVILGTAAYMSPEQARGKPVDKRTDIWAFGCVLYELLTGKPAFQGEDTTEILAAVVMREPGFNALPQNSPASIRVLLERCLRKDRRQRIPDAAALRIEIEDTLKGAGDVASQTATPSMAASGRKDNVRLAWGLAAFLLLTTIGLGVSLAYFHRPAGEDVPVQFSVFPPDRTGFDSGGAVSASPVAVISPNGRQLAFTAKDSSGKVLIWVRPLGTLEAESLKGTDDAAFPFWSPDSRSLAFFAQGKLKRIDVPGGATETLCDAPDGRGGTWNREGIILFSANFGGPLYRVTRAGGTPAPVTKPTPAQVSHRWPSFLPDGRHFLYLATSSSAEYSGIYLGTLGTTEARRMINADTGAVYSASGELLFVRQDTLFRQPFDLKKLQLSGDPVPIVVGIAAGLQNASAFSVSENRVLAYLAGPRLGTNLQLVWVDRAGKVVDTLGPPGAYHGIDLSPDGNRVAAHRHDDTGGDIWLFDSARRGAMSRFTFDSSQDNSVPLWSPDGRRVAFASLRNGKWAIYQKQANGTGREELLLESDFPLVPMSWSPDAKLLAYQLYGKNYGSDLWLLPLTGERKPTPFLESKFRRTHPQISPDGKWIAFSSNETGKFEIYVRPFPSGEGQWQLSNNGGTFPRWRADGKELFYTTSLSLGKLMAVKVNPAGSTFEYASPVELFDSEYLEVGHLGLNYHVYAVSLDGQRFLIPRPESGSVQETASAPITVVLNWTAGLKK